MLVVTGASGWQEAFEAKWIKTQVRHFPLVFRVPCVIVLIVFARCFGQQDGVVDQARENRGAAAAKKPRG